MTKFKELLPDRTLTCRSFFKGALATAVVVAVPVLPAFARLPAVRRFHAWAWAELVARHVERNLSDIAIWAVAALQDFDRILAVMVGFKATGRVRHAVRLIIGLSEMDRDTARRVADIASGSLREWFRLKTEGSRERIERTASWSS